MIFMKWWNDSFTKLQLPLPILQHFPPPNQYEPNDWQKFHPLLNAKLFIYMTHSDIHYSAVDVKWLNKTLIDLLDNNMDFFLLGLDDIPDEQFSFFKD